MTDGRSYTDVFQLGAYCCFVRSPLVRGAQLGCLTMPMYASCLNPLSRGERSRWLRLTLIMLLRLNPLSYGEHNHASLWNRTFLNRLNPLSYGEHNLILPRKTWLRCRLNPLSYGERSTPAHRLRTDSRVSIPSHAGSAAEYFQLTADMPNVSIPSHAGSATNYFNNVLWIHP